MSDQVTIQAVSHVMAWLKDMADNMLDLDRSKPSNFHNLHDYVHMQGRKR